MLSDLDILITILIFILVALGLTARSIRKGIHADSKKDIASLVSLRHISNSRHKTKSNGSGF